MDANIKEILVHSEVDIKAVIKWVLAPLLAKALDCKSNVNEDFCIMLNFWNYSDTMEVFMPFKDFLRMNDKPKKRLKVDGVEKPEKLSICNHNIDTILKLPKSTVLTKLGAEVLPINFSTSTDVELYSSNVFVCGNYLKFSRNICQTPWEVDGKKLYEVCLSDEIAKVIAPQFLPISNFPTNFRL